MNHAGEIAPLARLARPHVAVITTIAKAHVGHLGSIEAIADEKASIIEGLEPGGIAVLPADSEQLSRVRAAAGGAEVLTFGADKAADVRLVLREEDADGSLIHVDIVGHTASLRLNAPGQHMAMNALATLAVVVSLGLDPIRAIDALEAFLPLLGRGMRRTIAAGSGSALLLDESYNGNGASMRAALDVLRLQPALRRVAVLGDMLELGEEGPAEHAALADAVAGVGGLSFQLRAFDAFAVRRSPRRGARISCRGFRRAGAGGSRCPAQRRCGSGEGQPGQRHEARDHGSGLCPDLLRHRRSRLMLYVIFRPLADEFILFNLFRYITFRSGAACLTALVVSFLLGPAVIRWLKSMQKQGQPIRLDGPERHLLEKKGTPTMGGLLILGSLTISTLLWVDLYNGYVWAVLFVTLGYGALGFCDDYLKLTRRNTRGVPGRVKLVDPGGHRPARRGLDRVAGTRAARHGADCPGVQGSRHPVGLLLPGVRHAGDDGGVQRGEPDRWVGRAGDRADDDRRVAYSC